MAPRCHFRLANFIIAFWKLHVRGLSGAAHHPLRRAYVLVRILHRSLRTLFAPCRCGCRYFGQGRRRRDEWFFSGRGLAGRFKVSLRAGHPARGGQWLVRELQ